MSDRIMLTIFVGEIRELPILPRFLQAIPVFKVDRKKQLYESELFFEPHLDKHTTREAEEEMAENSAHELKTLDEEKVNWLKDTFPGVTKLRIIIGSNCKLADVMVNVNHLLEHWAEKLETLGIWTGYQFDTATYLDPFHSLFAIITEKLPSLQYLIISAPLYVGSSFNFDLSFLGQLKLFSTNIHPKLLIDSLNHYGAILENLPEIRFFSYCDQTKLLEMPPRLAAKITALCMDHVSYHDGGIEQLKAFFSRFPELKWYKLLQFWDKTIVCDLLIALSQLSHLVYLELNEVPFDDPECFISQQDLPPLSALETLSISGNIRDRHFLEPLGPLDHLFPVLKCINMDRVYMDYDSTIASKSNRIRKHWVYRAEKSDAFMAACKAYLQETVSALMLTFAQLRLKGCLTVARQYLEKDCTSWEEDRHIDFDYEYKEEFNFADGGRFEDWQYKEENVEINDNIDYDSYSSD